MSSVVTQTKSVEAVLHEKADQKPPPTPKEALQALFSLPVDDTQRSSWLKRLGSGNHGSSKKEKSAIFYKHEDLVNKYHEDERATESDEEVLNELLKREQESNERGKPFLAQLFSHGSEGGTILHVILERSTYGEERFNFDRVKPLIRFLLKLHPDLPSVESTEKKGLPIFSVLKSNEESRVFEPTEKREIVRFLCEDQGKGGLKSRAAINSLVKLVDSGPEQRHAIHSMIESSDFDISDELVAELSKITTRVGQASKDEIPCLEMRDGQGRTCLHIALTARSIDPPFNERRIWWAQKLAELCPNLLKATCKIKRPPDGEEQVTPLQHFAEQRINMTKPFKEGDNRSMEARLKELEASLKRQCLVSFDNATCKRIMYKKDSAREIFLTLDDDIVSWEFLESQKRHYKLDTSLKRVHICSSVSVYWDDLSLEHRRFAAGWGCAGNVDLFMVFHWLKTQAGVKKILEVVVHDGARRGGTADEVTTREKKPHSDTAIVHCLKDLGVETLDWQRMDIPADVICEGAGQSIKTLYLYCSGLKAVLQSWADSRGLVQLKNLENVTVEIDQGLESIECIQRYAKTFKEDLQKTFDGLHSNTNRKRLNIRCTLAPPKRSTASKVKSKNEQGFEEQDWLKCMDEFADVMEAVEQPANAKFGIKTPTRSIRVALIDDGVKTSYAGLDNNIYAGKSGWYHLDSNTTHSGLQGREYFRNYNSSHTGHGTVMAYYIKRVCPKVHLYVAKLDPSRHRFDIGGHGERITFSRESVAEAIEWAVEEEVDIISMSWAIDKDTTLKSNSKDTDDRLRNAIGDAISKNILLFCANPDKGPSYGNNDTYPRGVDPDHVFCVGAATQDGVRWSQIDSSDDSCNYFLPGVELGIQVESTTRKFSHEPPQEWRKHSGSSLSCALAAGLAAMILHCSLVSGVAEFDTPSWRWLRSHDGMRMAFEKIQVERTSGWLPVRRFFEPAVKKLDSNNEEKSRAIIQLMRKIFTSMPAYIEEPQPESAPIKLMRQSTSHARSDGSLLA
ncbi:hypothetical protein V8C26DRAFT_391050 [Trichoderma gracile]